MPQKTSIRNKLEELIINNKTEQAINFLLELSPTLQDRNLHNEILTLAADYQNYLSQAIGHRILTFEEKNTWQNKINQSLIHILEKLPENKTKPLYKTRKKSKLRSYSLLAVLIISIALFYRKWTINQQVKLNSDLFTTDLRNDNDRDRQEIEKDANSFNQSENTVSLLSPREDSNTINSRKEEPKSIDTSLQQYQADNLVTNEAWADSTSSENLRLIKVVIPSKYYTNAKSIGFGTWITLPLGQNNTINIHKNEIQKVFNGKDKIHIKISVLDQNDSVLLHKFKTLYRKDFPSNLKFER